MSKLFVISGLSGAGKDSVISALKEVGLDYVKVITTTTRKIRPGEEKSSYHFVSEDQFKNMISRDEFFEWAEVYNNYYGNTKQAVKNALSTNKPVILRVDCQGAQTVKQKNPQVVVIFIIPPSLKILEKRLRKRGQDSEEVIQRRLAVAEQEMTTLKKWDYIVVNKQGKLKKTAKKVKKIILKECD